MNDTHKKIEKLKKQIKKEHSPEKIAKLFDDLIKLERERNKTD